MSLLFNMLSKFVIAFLPRRKRLLISWLQSKSTVILEPKKIKSVTISIFTHLFATWGRKNTYIWMTESLCYSPETLTTFLISYSVQFSSFTLSCLTLCDSMDCSTPGFPVHHQLLEPTQTHIHHGGDAIQPSHPLSSPSPPTFNLSQYQGLFQRVGSSHQVLEFQLQHQSFQWIFRTDFL